MYNAISNANAPLNEYKKAKIKLLERDFYINVTEEERMHIETLESQMAVDRYCRTILKNRWKC